MAADTLMRSLQARGVEVELRPESKTNSMMTGFSLFNGTMTDILLYSTAVRWSHVELQTESNNGENVHIESRRHGHETFSPHRLLLHFAILLLGFSPSLIIRLVRLPSQLPAAKS